MDTHNINKTLYECNSTVGGVPILVFSSVSPADGIALTRRVGRCNSEEYLSPSIGS